MIYSKHLSCTLNAPRTLQCISENYSSKVNSSLAMSGTGQAEENEPMVRKLENPMKMEKMEMKMEKV